MTKKFFFIGMTVLLSVSLFFLGCEDGTGTPEESEKSSNTVTDQNAVTVKGVAVTWVADAAKTGASFATAIEGSVEIPADAAGESNFAGATGATVVATLVDAEPDDDSTLAGGFTQNAAAPAAGTHYLYLKVTAEDGTTVKWFKITITVVAVEAALPTSGSFQVVTVADGKAKLKVGNEEKWYTLPGTETAVSKAITAIWEPNKPNAAADAVESGKTAVAYTAALSAAVLELFTVNAASPPTVHIKGSTLPGTAQGDVTASDTNLIVIDVGDPNNAVAGLPTFSIPLDPGLGDATDEDANYAHIRLRVNSGASLVIDADNSNYINNQSDKACPPGNFTGGCVEVMAGGYLRDGAYEGFPLGTDAVILTRWGSTLSVGPEPTHTDATGDKSVAYNAYYKGALIGPAPAGGNPAATDYPRITWDAQANGGNTANSYLEVRPGVIATDAQLTVKKGVGLIYSVWFVDNAKVTIDADYGFADSDNDTTSMGLFANENTYKFYAKAAEGNTTKPVIVVVKGIFHGLFFANGTAENSIAVTNQTSVTVYAPNTGSLTEYVDDSTGIDGYPIPPLSTGDT
jgi:hypothetical protein